MDSAKPDSPFSKAVDAVGLNYQGTGVRRGPAQYPAYHLGYPNKFVVGTETTSTFSSRGVYSFPVVSDKLGTPATSSSGAARSSYSGILDLAGFKKDRFFLYQSRWRPEHAMAHILPHWT